MFVNEKIYFFFFLLSTFPRAQEVFQSFSYKSALFTFIITQVKKRRKRDEINIVVKSKETSCVSETGCEIFSRTKSSKWNMKQCWWKTRQPQDLVEDSDKVRKACGYVHTQCPKINKLGLCFPYYTANTGPEGDHTHIHTHTSVLPALFQTSIHIGFQRCLTHKHANTRGRNLQSSCAE